jgi:hypothetical protein
MKKNIPKDRNVRIPKSAEIKDDRLSRTKEFGAFRTR